jgi:hypothetical protein
MPSPNSIDAPTVRYSEDGTLIPDESSHAAVPSPSGPWYPTANTANASATNNEQELPAEGALHNAPTTPPTPTRLALFGEEQQTY